MKEMDLSNFSFDNTVDWDYLTTQWVWFSRLNPFSKRSITKEYFASEVLENFLLEWKGFFSNSSDIEDTDINYILRMTQVQVDHKMPYTKHEVKLILQNTIKYYLQEKGLI